MNKIENYLGIANHDIQIANNSDELKSYVASLLCEIDDFKEKNERLKETLDETILNLKSCVLELMNIAKKDYYWIMSNKIEKAKDETIGYKVMGNNDTKFFIDKGDSNVKD